MRFSYLYFATIHEDEVGFSDHKGYRYDHRIREFHERKLLCGHSYVLVRVFLQGDGAMKESSAGKPAKILGARRGRHERVGWWLFPKARFASACGTAGILPKLTVLERCVVILNGLKAVLAIGSGIVGSKEIHPIDTAYETIHLRSSTSYEKISGRFVL